MKEIDLQNCYDLYTEKFGESIKEILEQTIIESQQEIDSKIKTFVRKNVLNPVPTDTNSTADTKEKRILNEFIDSKNLLLNLLNSPYVHLYMRYQENVPELARAITWHWLSSPAQKIPMPTHLKYENLKEILVSIGFHSSIYYGSDRFLGILKDNDPTVNWPKKEQLEIYQIKQLEGKLFLQKKLYASLESLKKEGFDKQTETCNRLEQELDHKKDELSKCRAELHLLKGSHFYHEDDLFANYVFGDILPELKSVYNIFKEYKLYDSNWGYFSHCLSASNYSSPDPLKLKISLKGSSFDTKDLGYIFNLLQNNFIDSSKTEFIKWLTKVIEIESSRGNSQDITDFYRKHIRPYNKGKSEPTYYDQITEKLHFFVIRSS